MNESIQSKADILHYLDDIFNEVAHFLTGLTKEQFIQTPEEKWSSGQQLEHLIRSTKPVYLLLQGDIANIEAFGKPERASWVYDELVKTYLAHLEKGGKAMGRFIPKQVNADQKEVLIQEFVQAKEELIKGLLQWQEEQMDNYCIPHPLIGKLTVREMMFFTIYHTRHHLQSIKKSLRNVLN